jgi:hypothetical protein
LTEEEISSVEEGLIDLTTLLPKNPGMEKVQAMLNAELNGEEFKEDKADNGFSDNSDGLAAPRTTKAAPAASAAPAKITKPAAPAAEEEAAGGDADVDEMLAAIRARRAGKK